MGGAPRPGPSLLPVHGQPRLQGHTLRPSLLCCLAFLASASQPCSEEVSSDFRITAGIFPCLFYNRSVGGVASQRPAYFVRLHLERLPLGKSAEARLALLYSQVSGIPCRELLTIPADGLPSWTSAVWVGFKAEAVLAPGKTFQRKYSIHPRVPPASLAGVSRSVTLVVAYIMTVTDFGWEDALRTVRAGRSCANPNLGFQRQLQEFEEHQVCQFRQWLKEEYGESPLRDAEEARGILEKHNFWS
ncbi:dual specificity protein phosphatase 22 isoform X4 [Phocoena sinus]|uniref:dual specificity protein phosphatase 22 isoform X4 n=1 Tax=Phocoena sinus TaxID=42100 RepID=UPI0013C42E1F|nr:dual specificity protein phosphatase 22 isoform X4 [Phocoena sinus]